LIPPAVSTQCFLHHLAVSGKQTNRHAFYTNAFVRWKDAEEMNNHTILCSSLMHLLRLYQWEQTEETTKLSNQNKN